MRLSYLFTKIALGALFALGVSVAAADTYKIDPIHSEVSFKVRHLGLSKVSGRFTRFQGVIRLDEARLAASSVEVNIESASINTDNEARDKHLRNADFFDVDKFPFLSFRSVAVREVAKGKLEVTGDFTMHGVTRRIVIPMTALGGARGPSNDYRIGFEGTLTLNRSDYGIKGYPGVIGEEVAIALEIEAVRID
ncbi:MAG TPA: YceI family protein [Holophaga sp.]|nr:YceI family protein [Holophaga sp.]